VDKEHAVPAAEQVKPEQQVCPALADIIAASGRGPRVHEPHDPEAQALHRVVRHNLATFYAAIEEGWAAGLPEFAWAKPGLAWRSPSREGLARPAKRRLRTRMASPPWCSSHLAADEEGGLTRKHPRETDFIPWRWS